MSNKQSPARAVAEKIGLAMRSRFGSHAEESSHQPTYDIEEAARIIDKHYAERETAHKRLVRAAERTVPYIRLGHPGGPREVLEQAIADAKRGLQQ